MKKAIFLSAIVAVLSLVAMTGCASNKPYIGENGNWWVGDSDLGVPATGPQGETGPQGPKGEGVTVVSVEKTGTSGLVDTYTITFSDGTKTAFTVTNGPKGDSITVVDVSIRSSENGVDTYLITFSDGYLPLQMVKMEKISQLFQSNLFLAVAFVIPTELLSQMTRTANL